MGLKEIGNLEQRLFDLSYVLRVLVKESALAMEQCEDENDKIVIENGIEELKNAEISVTKFLDVISDNRESLAKQVYNTPQSVASLKKEVDNLESSINVLISGNNKFVSEITK